MLRARDGHLPSSIGWRSISSTSRGNSGNSSRNSTPLCARLTSPGRGMPMPPPISPASEMVWCGERNGRSCSKPGAAAELPGDAVDLGGLERFLESQRRQDAGKALRQHALARARRPDHQHVVRARGRHFQRSLGHGLPAHVAKIRSGGDLGRRAVAAFGVTG